MKTTITVVRYVDDTALLEDLSISFDEGLSTKKDKSVLSLDLEGLEYKVFVNDLTIAINGIITHHENVRAEVYNTPLTIEEKIQEIEDEIIEELE